MLTWETALSTGQLTELEGEPGGGQARRARSGHWARRELPPPSGGRVVGTAVGAPGSQPAASASAQAGRGHGAGEKKPQGQTWPPGGGQWPELRLWPPGSRSCPAAPRKAPRVTVAPNPEKPSLAGPLAPPASGRCGGFPRSAICAHSWFSPVVTRARPGARRTRVHA